MSPEDPARVEQPRPKHIEGAPSVHDQLIESIRARKALGLERYGTILQAGATGRDSLTDALQEALDLAAYLQALVEERRQERAQLAEMQADRDSWRRTAERLESTLRALRATGGAS